MPLDEARQSNLKTPEVLGLLQGQDGWCSIQTPIEQLPAAPQMKGIFVTFPKVKEVALQWVYLILLSAFELPLNQEPPCWAARPDMEALGPAELCSTGSAILLPHFVPQHISSPPFPSPHQHSTSACLVLANAKGLQMCSTAGMLA